MIHTTRGIVLHSFKYSDTSVIARILTRELGLQSYLVPGVRKSKSTFRANLFQPFNLVEMVVYHKESSGLQRIREIRSHLPTGNITADIRKSSIAIFLSEVMLNVFKHQEPQQQAFDYIFDAVAELDNRQDNLSLFHHVFLLQLGKYIGFSPGNEYSSNNIYFNMREGLYQAEHDVTGQTLTAEESQFFSLLSQSSLFDKSLPVISAPVRKALLEKIVLFYRMHLEGFPQIKSLQVLEVVFQ
jgi:DNA repair protein RecO (recombination protein O)